LGRKLFSIRQPTLALVLVPVLHLPLCASVYMGVLLSDFVYFVFFLFFLGS